MKTARWAVIGSVMTVGWCLLGTGWAVADPIPNPPVAVNYVSGPYQGGATQFSSSAFTLSGAQVSIPGVMPGFQASDLRIDVAGFPSGSPALTLDAFNSPYSQFNIYGHDHDRASFSFLGAPTLTLGGAESHIQTQVRLVSSTLRGIDLSDFTNDGILDVYFSPLDVEIIPGQDGAPGEVIVHSRDSGSQGGLTNDGNGARFVLHTGSGGATEVPEPGSFLLFGILGGLVSWKYRGWHRGPRAV